MTAYEIALKDMEEGVKECSGLDSCKRILDAFECCTYNPGNDETAWCSSIMNLWQKEAGNEYTKSAAARSWLAWGKMLKDPVEGCVVILKRNNSPTSGHVTFFCRQIGDKIECLGGNQGDCVKKSWYSIHDVLGYRSAE